MPRVLDIAIALLVLLLLSPVLLIAAVAIKLGSRGPVFYRQRRVGLDDREFEMLKLRTMVQGSDPVGVGTVVTRDDPRVTSAGRFLRRTSLDEIPNLINVLRGEMAIVGPRPTIPAQVDDYTPRQRRRHEVRPGITGWASPGRSGSSSTSITSSTAASPSISVFSPGPPGCWLPATGSRPTN
jgi:lipopolysaccharide/colanic/teichoic acid biosynthesis glycosyltransferase